MTTTQTQTGQPPAQGAIAKRPPTLTQLLSQDEFKKRFDEVMGRKAPAFISSIITIWRGSKQLQACDPQSIIGAAVQAAALNLSIIPTFGQAAIVPYKDKASFQVMTRGLVQLAHRTGDYKRIHMAPVYEGQLISYNEHTGEVKLNAAGRKSDLVEGFYFFFELLNGYRHEAYWSAMECVRHGLKYSKSFQYGNGQWVEDPLMPKNPREFKGLLTDGSGTYAMAAKTVIKNELNRWGPLSADSDLAQAIRADQAVIKEDGTREYVDSTAEPTVDSDKVPDPQAAEGPTDQAPTTEAPKTDPQPAQPAGEQTPPAYLEANIEVERVAKTTIGGNPAVVITAKGRDKYYADHQDAAHREAVEKTAKANAKLHVTYEQLKDYRRIEQVAPAK